jgi:uncharacterized protein YhdP
LLIALKIARRTLFWVLLGLGLALVVLLGRLSTGPVALDWLQPRIERALAPDDGKVAVRAERVELRLNQERRSLELVGVDVRYIADPTSDPASRPFLTFPEVEITLSVEAFLKHGMIAASYIKAKAPSLVVKRNDDGSVGLYSDLGEDGTDDMDFGDFLRRFVHAAENDVRLYSLKRLQIGGGRVAYYDPLRAKSLTAEAADLVLTRHDESVEGWVRADVLQPSAGRAVLQISGRTDLASERTAFSADIADLMPSDLPALWPLDDHHLPAELSGLHLPVSASIEGAYDLESGVSPLDVNLQSEAGVVDLPEFFAEAFEIENMTFGGRLAGDFTALEIERLALESRGAKLTGAGDIGWQEGQQRARLDVDIANLRAEDLRTFWPPELGADARAWVVENIPKGRVREGRVRLDLEPADFGPEPLPDEAVDGTFDFEGLEARYIGDMPPLEAAVGKVSFDADRMHFDVESGRNAGLELRSGTVTITGMGKPGKLSTQLQVLADIRGSIDDALLLLDHPPLEVAKELSIQPSTTSGQFTTRLDVRLPLHDDVTEDEAVVLAEADLSDAALDGLPKLGDDVQVRNGQLKLSVEDEKVTLAGTADVNGIPLSIDILEPRDEVSDQHRRIGIAGLINTDTVGLPARLSDSVAGEVDVKATVTETDSHFWIDLEADLAALALMPPGINWEKSKGDAGRLHASVAMPLDGPIEIKQFDLETDDLEAAGAFSLPSSGESFGSVELTKFKLGETDTAIRITPDDDRGFEIAIEAAVLDLDALFGRDGEIDRAFERFRAIVRADRLLARGLELENVEADARHASEGWRTASVIGTLTSGSKLALELSPEGDARRLEFRSEDAGALIKALDLGQRVEGGRVLLTMKLPADGDAVKEGRLEVGDFLLLDAPLLARMLTLASLTGIGNLLGGEGIQIDQLTMPFTQTGRTLTIAEGLMRGSQLGVTTKGDIDLENETLDLAGTIIPVYSLNRLIGQVPVIGRILTGTDGHGAFAATYGINGPSADPSVYVNPLSIVTPGLLRDLVGGILSGTLEPPEERETDD